MIMHVGTLIYNFGFNIELIFIHVSYTPFLLRRMGLKRYYTRSVMNFTLISRKDQAKLITRIESIQNKVLII